MPPGRAARVAWPGARTSALLHRRDPVSLFPIERVVRKRHRNSIRGRRRRYASSHPGFVDDAPATAQDFQA
jgi:hypothetical protein